MPHRSWSPAYCTMSKFQPCPLHYSEIISLAHNLIPLPMLCPDETYPALSWWTQAHLNPCQGCHLLQEGFGLSSSPILLRRGAGSNVVSPKQVVVDEVWCLNRHNSMGPATGSLDHRAGAYYLPYGLSYNEHRHAHWHVLTFRSPLHIIETCFILN